MIPVSGFMAFYTDEYKKFLQPFFDNMEAIGGASHWLCYRESTGDHKSNTGLKPESILQMMDSNYWDNRSVMVYTDIDCGWNRIPEIPTRECSWDVGFIDNPHPGHKNRIASCAIAFRDTPGARDFLVTWRTLCRLFPNKEDHPLMTRAMKLADFVRADLAEYFRGAQEFNRHKEGAPKFLS
jgi:hypothetical protein